MKAAICIIIIMCVWGGRGWGVHINDPLLMDPLSYFLFQLVLYNWYNKNCCIYYLVYGVVHINDSLMLIRKTSLDMFPMSLSEWSLTMGPMPCNSKYKYVECIVFHSPTLSTVRGARCSSVVGAFAHGTMSHQIDPSWWSHWPISRSSQCSMTGVTKAVVCAILSVGWCI